MRTDDVTTAQALDHIARGYVEKVAPMLARCDAALRRGVPERQVLSLLAAYDETAPAVVAARRWVTASCGTFVLAGPVGTGKTIGAAVWAYETGARWTSAVELANLPPVGLADAIDRLVDCDALVIDEIGGPGATSDRGVSIISSVLAGRHERLHCTLLTTNLTRPSFAQHLDGCPPEQSRICDRIREAGEFLDVRGASRRSAPLDLTAATERLRRMRRFMFLLDPIGDMARGNRDENPKVLSEMAALCKVTDDQLEAAKQKIAEQSTRIDEMLSGLLKKWTDEKMAETTDA